MNMRKNMKNNLGNRGFSLVELIVVISIMAILAAVAVIGVSVYVDKAAEAADRQTITDIEDALILGAYSNADKYAPGTIIGVVSISKDAPADCADNEAINQMMTDVFGDNWKNELKLKSDMFIGMDAAKVLASVRDGNEKGYYDFVPNSSFYSESGNTKQLAQDVDQVASALKGYLEANGTNIATTLWGNNYAETVPSGLDYTKDKQMAANITVFAAASAITDSTNQQELINGWDKPYTKVAGGSGSELLTSLVMKFARCTAIKNFVTVENGFEDYQVTDMENQYNELMKGMNNLNREGATQDFNEKITNFEDFVNQSPAGYMTKWLAAGRAETDAKAFIATMSTVNELKDTYVSENKLDVLTSPEAFYRYDAAELLDNMVTYSKYQGELPAGDYFIMLVINDEGVPTIVSALPRN